MVYANLNSCASIPVIISCEIYGAFVVMLRYNVGILRQRVADKIAFKFVHFCCLK